MEQLILVVYVLLSAAMIGLILLQQGKGADMGASFGSGASQTVFGSAGSGNVLTRGTAILATLFFVASVGLAVMAKHKAEALREGEIPVPAVTESRDLPQLPGDMPVPEQGAGEPAAQDVPQATAELPVIEQQNAVQETGAAAAQDVPSAPVDLPAGEPPVPAASDSQ